MLQIYKFDQDGKYIEPIMIEADEKGIYSIPDDCTDVPLPQPNFKPVYDLANEKWVETMSEDEMQILMGNSLENIKKNRYNHLDLACNSAILGRFSSTIDGLTYEFSYDVQAQSNISGSAVAFTRGYINSIEWTCYLNGERTSIVLNEEQFDIVAKNALIHVNSNIAKFREKIVELNNATTVEIVNSIEW